MQPPCWSTRLGVDEDGRWKMQAATQAGSTTMAAGRGSAKDAEFSAWMSARQPALLRTAYLLCGEHHGAEDLVQVTLAKVYLNWTKVHTREAIDGYARRILVNEHNSLWRRAFKKRETLSAEIPGWIATRDVYDEGRGSALWELVQTLPPKQRAAVVRSEERRVGNEGGSTCRARWAPYH